MGGSKRRGALCSVFPFHTWSQYVCSNPHPAAFARMERDKQKGSLLRRCYFISFHWEENLPEHPSHTRFPLPSTRSGSHAHPCATRQQRRMGLQCHRMEPARFTPRFWKETHLPCSLLHVTYQNKSVVLLARKRQGEVAVGGSG